MTAASEGFQPGPLLSIIIPTFNERENVTPLILRLRAALQGLAWEIIVVDDSSPDRTFEQVRLHAQADRRVRCIRRIGRRGLAGACIEGIMASSAPFVAVMDGDLQHDEALLPKMLAMLQADEADIVVASRYMSSGSANGFGSRRQRLSKAGALASKALLRVPLSDPMSGFFMLRRERFDAIAPTLTADGFKLLLDIVSSREARTLRVAEIPYAFAPRLAGQSKLDSRVVLDFAGLLLKRVSGGLVPTRFALFAAIGLIGLIVHIGVLDAVMLLTPFSFAVAQISAAACAITCNFTLNNILTYSDIRLLGWSMIGGLIVFFGISSIGLIANVGVAFAIMNLSHDWFMAGIAGALMGLVWNYSVSRALVWRE